MTFSIKTKETTKSLQQKEKFVAQAKAVGQFFLLQIKNNWTECGRTVIIRRQYRRYDEIFKKERNQIHDKKNDLPDQRIAADGWSAGRLWK